MAPTMFSFAVPPIRSRGTRTSRRTRLAAVLVAAGTIAGIAPAVAATPVAPSAASTSAAVRYHWGAVNHAQSDEYNGTAVDLTKWGLFGTVPGSRTGCTPGMNGHGHRCASQVQEANGLLTVRATSNGITGGLYSTHGDFRYARLEVRERAVPTASNHGAFWNAVGLLFPQRDVDYPKAEIDFAERSVGAYWTDLHVHHGQVSSCNVDVNSREFHNYAIEWRPHAVTWYVDGAQVCVVRAAISTFSHANGGAQLDMFPTSGTLMQPARQEVDWIRMYPVPATEYRR